MAGNLGLSSPWARQALPEPMRAEFRRLVPDHWTVCLAVPDRPRRFRAWANNDMTGEYGLHVVERRTASAAVFDVILWLRGLVPDA